jgi:ABC-2 type transport system permease protein
MMTEKAIQVHNSQFAILGGKFAGVFVTLVIQTAVLLAASALIFHISWGNPLSKILVSSGVIIAATGFGVLLMSLVKNSRQTGPVLGGVLTLAGMLGGLFTNGIPNVPEAMDKVALIMPQGWALHAWKLSLAGEGAGVVIFPVTVLAIMGALFFGIGLRLFSHRFESSNA